MVREAPDEPGEGGTMRKLTLESTYMSERRFVLQSANQGVGMWQVQDEGGDIGVPEGFERVSRASVYPVLPEALEQGGVVQQGEYRCQFAQGILCK